MKYKFIRYFCKTKDCGTRLQDVLYGALIEVKCYYCNVCGERMEHELK